jgi:DNA-binding NarL/FixJ family response regulator
MLHVSIESSVPSARVLIVDDHSIVCVGLVALLQRQFGISVIGTAGTGREAVEAARQLDPDLIIMDLMLPDMNGVDATARILNERPQTRVIALSACHTLEHVYRALRAGVRGYVVKGAVCAELAQAVLAVHAGRHYFSPALGPIVLDDASHSLPAKSPMERLSLRERDVLRWIVAGSSSADIGQRLSLSRKTVDTYRSRMMVKLGVANRSALIRFAIEHEIMAM